MVEPKIATLTDLKRKLPVSLRIDQVFFITPTDIGTAIVGPGGATAFVQESPDEVKKTNRMEEIQWRSKK